MPTLLRIDASARLADSRSRSLADAVEARWLAARPAGAVVTRDLSRVPVAQIDEVTIAGFYTPAESMTDDLRAATATSDTLIAELMGADALLIATPMYNFGVPASLKAWIDQIVRIGRTFSYDGTAFTGLVTGRPAYVVIAAGASGYEGPLAQMDFVTPYIRGLLGFLGFDQIHLVLAEATTAEPAVADAHFSAARRAIDALAA